LTSGRLGFIEPSISWEVVALSALLEPANGMGAQPERVDAAVINSAPPRIQADFLFSAIAIPISRLDVQQINQNKVLPPDCDASITKHYVIIAFLPTRFIDGAKGFELALTVRPKAAAHECRLWV
jgi:hypothetical protein